MRLTFTLSDEQFAANDRAGVMVGLPLAAQLDAGPLVSGRIDGDGWIEAVNFGRASIRPVSLDRHVFCGRVGEVETWSDGGDTVCQAMLDCGVSLRFDLLAATPGEVPRVGDWYLGQASLRGLLAMNPSDLLWQTVTGAIVDIQRLSLDPLAPGFGTMHWLSGLPRQSFAPDQVFVTVEIGNR